jgi:hypothetical protein
MQGIGCIKVKNAASRKVEVHELSRADGYSAFHLHAASAIDLAQAGDFMYGFTYGFSPLDTLFGAIKTRDTGTRTVEVHLMSRSSGYSEFVHQSGTAIPLSQADDFSFSFSTVTPGDLYCVKRRNTKDQKVEVHVLSRASNYREFVLQQPTVFNEADAPNFDFQPRWSGLGIEGLLGIKHTATANSTVELQATGRTYDSYVLQTRTLIPLTDPSQFAYLFYPQNQQALVAMPTRPMANGLAQALQISSPFTGAATSISTALGASDVSNFVFKIIPEALHV